jgi:NAD(P)-dependent dehydrogenase (short-subunit alcohol dehydrogenase family)
MHSRRVIDMSVAIVTGGSRGLGEALAGGLARAGWSLVIDGRDPVTLREAAGRIESHVASGASLRTVPGDITDPDHRNALVEAAAELGGLSLVVNNAGVLGTSPLPTLAQYPLNDLRVALEVNVVSPLALIQTALPLLSASASPRIINITSDAGVEAYEGWGGYGAGKAALNQISAVLAVENPDLRVWAVDPGDLRTQMHQEAFPGEDISDRPEPESVVPHFLHLIESDAPSGRYRAADFGAADFGPADFGAAAFEVRGVGS